MKLQESDTGKDMVEFDIGIGNHKIRTEFGTDNHTGLGMDRDMGMDMDIHIRMDILKVGVQDQGYCHQVEVEAHLVHNKNNSIDN